jgi:hypothetical protein
MRNYRYPEAFQGNLKKKHYYEGWYNKIVNKNLDFSYAFIPTIAIDKKTNNFQAFIQILNGETGKMHYIRYDLEEFENLSNSEFAIRIKNSYFSTRGMILDIQQEGINIEGIIKYVEPVLWPRSFLQPNVMGILNYIPFLETYHGIVSMNHNLKGSLQINRRLFDFNDGKGYVEKDWGGSFPRGYIWSQCNHFQDSNLSIVTSVALVPLFGIEIKGFFCIIWHNGSFYKFTTYTNARIKYLKDFDNFVKIIIEDKKYVVLLRIDKTNLEFTKLKAPRLGNMSFDIIETLNSGIKLQLFDKKSQGIILNSVGTNAGLDLYNIDLLE